MARELRDPDCIVEAIEIELRRRRPRCGWAATRTMYRIDVTEQTTASADFHIIRNAALERYRKLYTRHSPGGSRTRKREASQREIVASSYTVIITQHALTMVDAFNLKRYASGFALARPVLEALLKQMAAMSFSDEGNDWRSIPDKRFDVTVKSLTELSARTAWPNVGPLWGALARPLNDFVHGGRGQLTSNPIDKDGKPIYTASLFWGAMLIATLATVSTHALFWEHLGDEDRTKRALDDLATENWDRITISRNGQTVHIVGRSPDEPA